MLPKKLKRTGLFLLTTLLFSLFMFYGTGDTNTIKINSNVSGPVDQIREKDMSAITLSSLPFILVVKYLIPDAEE